MIIRGGGATGADGRTGAAACICVTLSCAGACAAGGGATLCAGTCVCPDRNRRSGPGWRNRNFRWNSNRRRRACGWRHRSLRRNHNHARRTIRCRNRGWRDHSRCWCGRFGYGLRWHCPRQYGSGRSLRFRLRYGRCRRWLSHGPRDRLLGRFFLLLNFAQHVSRTRNIREIDLGLDALRRLAEHARIESSSRWRRSGRADVSALGPLRGLPGNWSAFSSPLRPQSSERQEFPCS